MAWIEIKIDGGDLQTINLDFYTFIEPYESAAKTIFYNADRSQNLISETPFGIISGQLNTFLSGPGAKKFCPIFELNDNDDSIDKFYNISMYKSIYKYGEGKISFVKNDGEKLITGNYDDFVKQIKEFTAGIDALGNNLSGVLE